MSVARRRLLHPRTGDNAIADRTYIGLSGRAALAELDAVPVGPPELLDFRTRSARISSCRVQSIRSTPVLMVDRGSPPGRDIELRVSFIREGRIAIRQGGREIVLGPGDAVVGFDDVYAEAELLERTRFVTVTLDAVVPFPGGVPEERGMRYITSEEMFNSAAAAFFEALLRPEAFPLAPVDEVRTSRAISKLLSEMLMAVSASAGDSAELRREEERTVVRGYIAANFTRQDLSVASVAEHYGMSSRSLQRLYSDRGESVSNVIRQRRLEHAVAMLMDYRFDDLSIDDVAQRSGFAGANQLRRVMGQVMEQTPTDLRTRRG